MPITYEVLALERLIHEAWVGEITIDTVRRHWSTVLCDEACLAMRRTLADLRQASLGFSDRELHDAVLEVGRPLLAGRGWISAIVVQEGRQLRMASRYRAFASFFSQDAIFSSQAEALRWLARQETPPAGPGGEAS